MSNPYLSIAAIVKDEAPYIEEWIAFHQAVGVEHFRIYDNGSTDDTAEILSTIAAVTVLPFPGERMQMPAYADALRKTPGQWVAFIDADEFLFSPTYLPLPTVLRDYESYAAVGACWAVYGTAGKVRARRGLVTAGFTQRAPKDDPINRHVKSIVQPRRIPPQVPRDPHHFEQYPSERAVDEYHRPLDGPFAQSTTWDVLRINHYVSKSEQEAKAKMGRPRADNGQLRGGMDLCSAALNAERDAITWAYWALIRERMAMTP